MGRLFSLFLLMYSSAAFAITGTYLDLATLPAAQSCKLKIKAKPSGKSIVVCGATVIGDKTVLSANHCDLSKEVMAEIAAKRGFPVEGNDIEVLCPNVEPRLVVKRTRVVKPEIKDGLDLIYFETDKSIGVEPIALAQNFQQFSDIVKREDCAVLGYGLNNFNKLGEHNGVKANLYSTPKGLSDKQETFTYDMIYKIMIIDGSHEPIFEGPEPGDSGSGLFCKDENGTWHLMAVHHTQILGFLADSVSLGNLIDVLKKDGYGVTP